MSGLRRVRGHIDGGRIARLASELVRRPSQNPTDTEGEVASYVAGVCSSLGLETMLEEVLPGRPNVLAWLRGEPGPTLVFNAHLDTVPAGAHWTEDPFGGEIRDGRVYGRARPMPRAQWLPFLPPSRPW